MKTRAAICQICRSFLKNCRISIYSCVWEHWMKLRLEYSSPLHFISISFRLRKCRFIDSFFFILWAAYQSELQQIPACIRWESVCILSRSTVSHRGGNHDRRLTFTPSHNLKFPAELSCMFSVCWAGPVSTRSLRFLCEATATDRWSTRRRLQFGSSGRFQSWETLSVCMWWYFEVRTPPSTHIHPSNENCNASGFLLTWENMTGGVSRNPQEMRLNSAARCQFFPEKKLRFE